MSGRDRAGNGPAKKRRSVRSQAIQRDTRAKERYGLPLGRCPACGKNAFTSKVNAKSAAEKRFPGQLSRVYECHERPGFWHYTSQDSAETTIQRIVLGVLRDDTETAARWVAGYVAGTGEGPTWAELAAAMGWPDDRDTLRSVIFTLVKHGWLQVSPAPRSLRPGPALDRM